MTTKQAPVNNRIDAREPVYEVVSKYLVSLGRAEILRAVKDAFDGSYDGQTGNLPAKCRRALVRAIEES